jgi:hypothetical protein
MHKSTVIKETFIAVHRVSAEDRMEEATVFIVAAVRCIIFSA